MKRPIAPLLLGLLVCGCGDNPIDASGNYSMAVTNRDNGCGFANWTPGDTATGIQLTISQQGDMATATVGGLVGGWMQVVLGSNMFAGTVSGRRLDLTLYGTRSTTEAGCSYTVNAGVKGQLDGDILTGTIDYTPSTNGSPRCGAKNNCTTRQEFNGTRPPS